ncbi:MAG: class I SAM-dependent methyltransferase [Vicinamibacterales bacterium]
MANAERGVPGRFEALCYRFGQPGQLRPLSCARFVAMTTPYHAAHFTEHPRRAGVWRAIAAHLAPLVPADAAVLEVGAGYCHWINQVAARRRVALDIWPGVAEHAAPGVESLVADAGGGLATIPPASFDVVLASNVLEHFVPDVAAAVVGGLARVLRVGGRLIVIQPNFRYAYREYFDDYTHRAVFTDVSLPALLRAEGFAVDRIEPRFLPYSMRATRLPTASWLVRAYLASPYRPRAGQMLVVGTRR